LQMVHMRFWLTDGQKGLPGASKIYVERANMYLYEKDDFNLLLQQAHEEYEMKETSEELINDSGCREQFIEWLKLHNEIKYPYDIVVGSIDKASELALRNNIISCGLWNVSDAAELGMLIDKVIKNKRFRMNYKSLSIILGNCWECYDRFLKSISLNNSKNTLSQSDNVRL